jgi:hypothetical protein
MTKESAALTLGPTGLGPAIRLNAAGIELSVGGTAISLTPEAGIVLRFGEFTLSLSEAGLNVLVGTHALALTEAGCSVVVGDNTLNLTPAGVAVTGTTVELAAVASATIEAPALSLVAEGVLKIDAALMEKA